MILTLLEALMALALSPYGPGPARVAPPPPPAPRAMIKVQLQSGRVFSGDVDSQTDGQELMLRTNMLGGFIARPIQWERVVRAEIAGEAISGDQLHQIVVEIRRTHPKPALTRPRLAVDSTGGRVSQGLR